MQIPVLSFLYKGDNDDTLSKEGTGDNLLKETRALATYVGRHGDILKKDQLSIYKNFAVAIKNYEKEQNTANEVALQTCYSALTAITYPAKGVNGHTILETRIASNHIMKLKSRPVFIGFLLFFFAIFIESFRSWVVTFDEADALTEPFRALFYNHGKPPINFLIGATWGGIGTCLFLMKRISDKMFMEAYQSSKVRGDMTRIFLGAMLGVCVVLLFFQEENGTDNLEDLNIGPAIAAFIAGLGIKPVYAAFETLAEEIAARLGRKKDD